MPFADTEAMQAHLDEIGRTVARGAHAVLLLDRTGWQTTDKLRVPRNITLIGLAVGSPELNPVENISQYLRGNWLSNTVFETYDDVIDAACAARRKLTALPDASPRSDCKSGPTSVNDGGSLDSSLVGTCAGTSAGGQHISIYITTIYAPILSPLLGTTRPSGQVVKAPKSRRNPGLPARECLETLPTPSSSRASARTSSRSAKAPWTARCVAAASSPRLPPRPASGRLRRADWTRCAESPPFRRSAT